MFSPWVWAYYLEVLGGLMGSIAHASGVDHLWVFLAPAVLALVLLRRAEKRARAKAGAGKEKEPSDVD